MRPTLGRYELLSQLGAGGMGEVYRARDRELGREVAVKVLPPHLAQDAEALARFKREARAIAALSHPNILSIFDFGTEAEVAFAVMELLRGETLRARLGRGPIAWRQAAEMGAALADGLAAAHAHGITHRDLKPENIFLTEAGAVKILDFGLARVRPAAGASPPAESTVTLDLTTSGTVMGTVGYMSPEQVRGEPTGPESDIFSLGCVLYEMVSGARAFRRPSAAETLTAVLHDEPPALAVGRSGVPAALQGAIRRCLQKEPAARYRSAAELALDLRSAGSAADAPRPPGGRARMRARPILWIAAAVLVGIVAWAAYRIAGPRGAIDSLAVLPFANASADPQVEYLSDGVSESIAHSLSQVATLRVMSHGSVMRYKGRAADARTAGRELGVRAVVLGEVSVHGDALALSVELVDASDRRLLWGERYTRRLEDVLSVQAEIAKQISEKLRLRLTGEEEQRLTKRYTGNPEAYRLYLQGRFHSLQWTTEGWEKGIEYLNQAVAADPAYALAYAGLAACYYDASNLLLPPSEAMPKAKEAARRALDLDETLAEAHCALAQVLAQYEWNRKEAQKEYERAIELNPNYATAHLYLGYFFLEEGRTDEAIAAATRANELDPLTPFVGASLGYSYYLARQYDTAIDRYRQLIDANPDFIVGYYSLGMCYCQKHQYEDAIQWLRTAKQRDPENQYIVSELAHTLAVAGKRDEALKLLGELRELGTRRYVDAFDLARVYVGLADVDEAFAQLERAYTSRSEQLLWLVVDPQFDPLRADPRFTALLRRIGLQS